MFMYGVTGDLIAMSTVVSDPVFMWTTGWGFFFGGFLFTREWQPLVECSSVVCSLVAGLRWLGFLLWRHPVHP